MSKYEKLYEQIKRSIIDGQYKYQEKLPSIRELERTMNLSRTTIEAAYMQLLTEGYIVSKYRSGYFVDVNLKEKKELIELKKPIVEKVNEDVEFDFSGKSVDTSSFDMELWKKYIKGILLNDKSLYAYGDQQGEYELRRVLTQYTSMYRGVTANLEQMIIGSGFQSLLQILCSLLKGKKIGMPKSGFIHAQMVFDDFDYEVKMIQEDEDGIDIEALKKHEIDILYLNTSSSGLHAKALPISKRLAIIEYAKKNNIYIIEDDHNGELRYNAKPIPAMQSQDNDHIIYIGSFSKLMIPSLRIAYMILPYSLLNQYLEKKDYYHQNVSKLEQLALAKYIEDGQLIRQLKKLRRIYHKKSILMIECLRRFPQVQHIQLEETALRVRVRLNEKIEENVLKSSGVGVQRIVNEVVVLSFSSIPVHKIEQGIEKIIQKK